jgi:transcription initiation factor TFIIH subunit 1
LPSRILQVSPPFSPICELWLIIPDLQQTPAGNPKVALKVVVSPAGAAAPENHVFSFTSAAARAEQEAITDILRNAIAAIKSAEPPRPATTPAIAQDASAPSAGVAMAQAASSTVKTNESWYDDTHLITDIELQRSLLEASPALRQRFNESLRDRPETITITQFSTQFWSTRLHLLRAHAIEKAQNQGDYNVLPEIKFTRVASEKEGEADSLTLRLAGPQIKLIFKQYPIVRQAYNENVPPTDSNTFWSRFFMSRLLKKLKGEKITDADAPDPMFDKYLGYQEKGPSNIGHVPHFIDLEGNEQNHSQRQGNRPDETMRPERVPILRILNNLSEKMMAQVAPADGEAHAPIGMSEDAFNELRLRDLQTEAGDNRVVLNIKDQQRLLGGKQQNGLSAEAQLYAKQPVDKVLEQLHTEMASSANISLSKVVGIQSDSEDSDDESRPSKRVRIGSKGALTQSTQEMLASISRRRLAASADVSSRRGLSQSTFDTLSLTHNTTVEFLHYFWTLFLSGDGTRSNELAKLVETLDRSVDRIKMVSEQAEKEKLLEAESLKKQISALNARSTKRRRMEVDLERLGGGKQAVEEMVKPTILALASATAQYRKAFEEQSAQAAA